MSLIISPNPKHLFFGFLAFCMMAVGASVPSFANDIEWMKHGVVKITAHVNGQSKVGTGIVIREESEAIFIATASHVIEGDPNPTVLFFSQPTRPVSSVVVGMEGGDHRGLALLVVRDDLPDTVRVLSLNVSANLGSGESVAVIGFPRHAGVPWAVTQGELVGRKGRDLVFSGAIDEGNSGGPLLKDNQVIGIVTESSPPFAYAAPAVLVQYAMESWGIRFGVQLRGEPAKISLIYLKDFIRQQGFHHPFDGSDDGLVDAWIGTFVHHYEVRTLQAEKVVLDHATGLMWQQGGSVDSVKYGRISRSPLVRGPTEYVDTLNQKKFAGFSNWRVPTIEELGSLMEPIGKNEGLFIAQVFDPIQWKCATIDMLVIRPRPSVEIQRAAVFVNFRIGKITRALVHLPGNTYEVFVRAVRTILPDG